MGSRRAGWTGWGQGHLCCGSSAGGPAGPPWAGVLPRALMRGPGLWGMLPQRRLAPPHSGLLFSDWPRGCKCQSKWRALCTEGIWERRARQTEPVVQATAGGGLCPRAAALNSPGQPVVHPVSEDQGKAPAGGTAGMWAPASGASAHICAECWLQGSVCAPSVLSDSERAWGPSMSDPSCLWGRGGLGLI